MFKNMARKKIPFLPREYERIVNLCSAFDFYSFWKLIDINYAAFKKKARALLSKKGKISVYENILLSRSASPHFIEQRQHMKSIAKRIGSRALAESIPQFLREMSIEEALVTPLPNEIGHCVG